ncbi:hypothetical protein [Brumimicrobium oceani]|uniref:Uncharacterized protein n=1 Tax=Brumimicrobium oceani TaxID=2100725 RepID=A0A2U2XE76_9FLAO|nr:hypothetical protein [Brumimicrobium oceani]PWH86094.1 hypothetical protein DIT68_05940 [Brumimicrobium oceani]
MKITLKTLFILKGLIIVGLVIWGASMIKSETKLKLKIQELEQNYNALDAYNEVLKYDLETTRDSVRILSKNMENNINNQ